MKKAFCTLLVFIMLLNTYAFASKDELNLVGEAAILIDYDSNVNLYEKNVHEKLYPASTTKIMTGILAIESGMMDDMVKVDEEIISLTEGSHIALDYDEEVSFEDLLNAMLIQSANDAALALGKHIAGSIEGFVRMMNEKATELGALDTLFVNPNGLHDENHVSTAYDIALFAKYAMKNEIFREIVAKDSYTIPPTNKKTEARYLYSTNKFLYGNEKITLDGKVIPIKYDGVSGVKTGTTSHAKHCLVSFAEKNGQRLLAVVLKSNGYEVYGDTHKLLNYGFTNFSNKIIGHANEFIDNISLENGEIPLVAAVLSEDIYYPINNGDSANIQRKVELLPDLVAPVSKGDILGDIEYYLDDLLIANGKIISTLRVEAIATPSIFQKILSKWYLVVFALFVLFRSSYLYNKSRRRKKRRSKLFKYSPDIR